MNNRIGEFIEASLKDVDNFIEEVSGHENEPRMLGYAELGVHWLSGACNDRNGLEDLISYRKATIAPRCAGWMDNTTLLTAQHLLSRSGSEALTPLTIWDLVTFARAVICFDRIYHHEHPEVDDAGLNRLLGAEILVRVALPLREIEPGRILPSPANGAWQWMNHLYDDAYGWLGRLRRAVGRQDLDGEQLAAVASGWRSALGRDDIDPADISDEREASLRWTSSSNKLLAELVDATNILDTTIYIDPDEKVKALNKRRKELGLKDNSRPRLNALLTDLNLRCYVNQRIADFFELPYLCSAARVPFRRHLYNRGISVQNALTTANVIDGRYQELAENSELKLPVFLAVALKGCAMPEDVAFELGAIRRKAAPFRESSTQLDDALARRDLKEAAKVGKALRLSADDTLGFAGKLIATASNPVVEKVCQGDLPTIKTGIQAIVAAGREAIQSSFAERLFWRLCRPHIFWMNNFIEEAHQITESLPSVAKIWRIPENRKEEFISRFSKITELQTI